MSDLIEDRTIVASTRKRPRLSIPQMALMSRLLEEALELDDAGRQRWLASLPPEHQELAPILREALLPGETHAARSTLATLPKFASAGEADGLPASSRLHPGAHVGPYELIRLLGAGGMAEVWLARRADGAFKREVALKLPKLHSQRADLAKRFVHERDILASLEHAHIARLYDAGIDAGGWPYLSMEYVQGESLLDWCDTRQLGIAARLELLLQVLDAMQYAHERQVIHRDLKPSNILVTRAGQVRLLDFGVAKLLEAESQAQAPLTEVYGRALTPDYASPELLRGDPADDRSDVYSLGVLLYELLTGARPYHLDRAASLGLLEPAIATVIPRKPSLQLTQPAAFARATTQEQLARQLRGDLDAIALKALAKEPAQRYPTVLALAKDLRRYLNGAPVQAHPARLIYRAKKFILRHKTGVTAITIAVAVIVLTLGYTLRREGRSSGKPLASGPAVAQSMVIAPSPGVAPIQGPTPGPFAPSRHSVAVLPFLDLSEKQDQAYFSDGLTEELLDLLAKVPGLQVIARTSSFSFKGRSGDIPTIARQLNVANILEGSVRKSGRRLRVTTHLVRAATGEELWSETYDRELRDIFQVQDEIAAAVTRALRLQLAVGPQAANTHRTSNTEAYNQYLLGRQFYQRDNLESEALAIEAFRKATQLDPGYAAAYAGLAMAENVVLLIGSNDASLPQQVATAADKAIALAPDEAGGYVARSELGVEVLLDWTGAQADLEKALANDPADSVALARYGTLLALHRRFPEAIAHLKRATELDPLSTRAWADLGVVLTHTAQFAAAHAALRRALEIQPRSIYVPARLGTLELLEGHASRALATFRTLEMEDYRLWGIALAEQSLGQARESQRALDEMIAKHAQRDAYQIAQIYAWRSDKDRAFAWLERAYRQHDSGLVEVTNDPLLVSLHGDARFAALLAKLHLP